VNILIIANHYAVCSARYAADAFVRMGHSVRHVGQPMGRDIWGMQVPQEYVWTPDAQLMEYDKLREWSPSLDLVITMDSDPAVLDWAGNASYFSAPNIVWGVDNHVREYRRPDFDHYFLAHKSVSVMDWGGDCTWLPCGYDGHWFTPSPIPWEQRQFDVCCIGYMYPQRWLLVEAMRDAGLKVIAGCGMVYDQYRDLHHNSRVALVSSACGDLPIRLFEGAGMGCTVLHDPMKDLDDLKPPRYPFFQTYQSVGQAVHLAFEASRYEDARTAERNIQWAQWNTWDIRAQVILDWLEARK
jgi:hypothetical protein